MRFCNILKAITVVTFLALIYTHLQMQIIHLAYVGKVKEECLKTLMEQNGELTYSILTLKSANHLGFKLLEENSDMEFVDPDNIICISASSDFFNNPEIETKTNLTKKRSPLLSFLAPESQAQAWSPE